MHRELETVLVDFDEETGIGNVTLDRPDSLNAMNDQMRRDIVTALDSFEEVDDEADGVAVRAVIVEGAGDRAFCAGADIHGFSDRNPAAFEKYTRQEAVADFPAPVIAKIDGYCLGGGLELAFACDFRYASARSTFGLPEVTLGIIPGSGGVQFVSRLANTAVAKELAMTGKHIGAERAADEGLVNEVHPAGELDAAVDEFAAEIASRAPLAVRAVKDSANMATETGLAEGLLYDRRIVSTLYGTHDQKEGAAAFAEKREPEFEGR